MDIQAALKGLDELYSRNRIDKVEGYLTGKLVEAMQEEDSAAVLSLLNELVGFYRDANQYEKSIVFGEKALEIIESEGLSGSVHHAATLLNYANGLRAAGRLDDAIAAYARTEEIYKEFNSPDDFVFAGLYNNLSLVYMEAGDYRKAADYLYKALDVVNKHKEGNSFELAVTHTNLGNCLLEIGRTGGDGVIRGNGRSDAAGKEQVEEQPDFTGKEQAGAAEMIRQAGEHLKIAEEIFAGRSLYDTHYAATVMGQGELFEQKGDLQQALYKYIRGMEAIRNNFGYTDYYYRVKERYDKCIILLDESGEPYSDPLTMMGLDICREYFRQIVLPSFSEKYPELLQKVAMGLIGPGSECYGFDDVISRDHDWGPAVCIWLESSDYKKWGEELKEWYDSLPADFMGFHRTSSAQGEGRVGILDYQAFVEPLLKKYSDEVTDRSRDIALSLLLNGEIFYDPGRKFFKDIESVKYTRNERIARMAYHARLFSQELQYNFRRMAVRGDGITAKLMLNDGFRDALLLAHAMSGRYAPHDKWLVRSSQSLSYGNDIVRYLTQIDLLAKGLCFDGITERDLRPVLGAIDELAAYLTGEMKNAGFLGVEKGKSLYMEDVAAELEAEYSGTSLSD